MSLQDIPHYSLSLDRPFGDTFPGQQELEIIQTYKANEGKELLCAQVFKIIFFSIYSGE